MQKNHHNTPMYDIETKIMESTGLSMRLIVIIVHRILSLIAWIILQALPLAENEEFISWSILYISLCYNVSDVAVNGYPLGTQIIALAFADFVILFPLVLAAITGLMNQEFYVTVSSWMVFGIIIYRTMIILWQATLNQTFTATGSCL